MIESETHFSTNINLGWQKANVYYTKTDAVPIYRVAVLLHPRLKWRWFERYWAKKPEWLKAARELVDKLWEQYRHTPIHDDEYTNLASNPQLFATSGRLQMNRLARLTSLRPIWPRSLYRYIQISRQSPTGSANSVYGHNSHGWLSTSIARQRVVTNQSEFSVREARSWCHDDGNF